MPLTPVESLTHADPTVRSDVYKLLSLVFKFPTQELFEAYQNGEFLSELFDTMSMLPHLKSIADAGAGLKDTVHQELAAASFITFQSQFVNTFDVGAPQPPCPPYEGVYREGVERTSLLIEVSGFYKHFGLKVSTEEGKREQPDHLSVELEFLHFLTFKEHQARKAGDQELLKGYVLAQKDFIERHLMSWIQQLSDKMQKSSAHPLFAKIAEMTAQVASAEFDLVKSMLDELGYVPSTEVKNNGSKEAV